jgi:hypothetical protein
LRGDKDTNARTELGIAGLRGGLDEPERQNVPFAENGRMKEIGVPHYDQEEAA